MSETKLQIEICSDTGCGLFVADIGTKQLRLSLIPDEVLEAKKTLLEEGNDAFIEFVDDIDPSFLEAIKGIGIETLRNAFLDKTKRL